jgi:hypothetical protein
MSGVHRVDVEVFPIAPERWIAVMEGPGGPFSTEARQPEQVEPEVRRAIAEVLGWTDVVLSVTDDQGNPWSLAAADAQYVRLGIR